ncbi:MAG: methylenetetrahydrofolate reductase [NAD(P)H], partial [Ruminococcaceae bacterium]|nr:methylenetetrahydrofolate reductase [NAD(P)H] [Oscillospiraceae bacterium]
DYAIAQIRDLIERGQKNIHIYTMNKPQTTREVLEGIRDLL